MSWILTKIIATHAGILTSQRSIPTHIETSLHWQRSPTFPDQDRETAASVMDLSPVTFSAQGLSTSELLRTL